jgi:hypothetical protein
MKASPHLRFCAERGRLLDLLNTAVSDYAAAINNLSRKFHSLSNSEYVAETQHVEVARMDAQQARDALRTHRAEHGC